MTKQTDLGWREAIIHVMRQHKEPMHYVDIAEELLEQKLRSKVGANPYNQVNVAISDNIKKRGNDASFVKVGPGLYMLRESEKNDSLVEVVSDTEEPSTCAIKALGMYWRRDYVIWNSKPRILGVQTQNSKPVDFSEQNGIYILYDRDRPIYAGRAVDQGLGKRISQHTIDRLNGRWDRFSWFGLFDVSEDGSLEIIRNRKYDFESVIADFEAILIEALEPVQNRKRGDGLKAVEFIQKEDEEIEAAQQETFIRKLLNAKRS
jgi:hypothetical protein